MIRKYSEIFCWKNVSSFCSAKATHIFSAKNIRILCTESAKTVNEMTLNELVKLTTLWTTGPRTLAAQYHMTWFMHWRLNHKVLDNRSIHTNISSNFLTLVMLNKLRCHIHFQFLANQIACSRLWIQICILNDKHCRSRSVGFFMRGHIRVQQDKG